jgi:hypothetical protein
MDFCKLFLDKSCVWNEGKNTSNNFSAKNIDEKGTW